MDKASIEKARDLMNYGCTQAKQHGNMREAECFALAAEALSWALQDDSMLNQMFAVLLEVEAVKYVAAQKARQN